MNNNFVNLSTFPNPSHGGVFNLKLDAKMHEADVTIEIFDSMGSKVINEKLNGRESLDYIELSSGLYMIRISSGSKILTTQHLIH